MKRREIWVKLDRPNMALGKSHFLLILVRAYGLKREREKIRREGRRKKEEGKEGEVQV